VVSTQNSDRASASSLPDDLAGRLWPDGMPSTDRAIWLSLSPERRVIALRRASAIDLIETSGAKAADAAEHAQISVPRFYSLVRAWKRNRSLADIVPHAAKRDRNTDRTSDEVRSAVRGLVETHPSLTQESIAKAASDRLDGAVSLSKLRRVVAQEKARRRRDRLGGDKGFGKEVLIDRSALDLLVRRADGVLDYAVFAAVLDVATNLVLAHAVGDTKEGGHGLQLEALKSVAGFDTGSDDQEVSETGPVPRIIMMPDAEGAFERLSQVGRMRSLGDGFEPLGNEGRRSVGIKLSRMLGGRIGQIRLRPGHTFAEPAGRLPAEEEGASVLSMGEACHLVSAAVVDHNERTMGDELDTTTPKGLVDRFVKLAKVWN
jgi:transposase